METKELSNVNVDALFERISALIEGARKTVATAVSVAEVYTKYEIGRYIVADEQNGKYRAAYGKQVLKCLADRLKREYGNGWSEDTLGRCRKFFGKRLRTYVLYINSVGSTFAKKTMRSKLPQERIDFYNRVLETYKEIIKVDPNYPFNKHCEDWSVRSDRISRWLVNHNIFVSRLKEEAIERLSREASERARSAQRVGAFVSVRPENDAMSGWRNTEIARVDVYLPGKVRLSLRKATAAEIISVVSTYAEKSSR